ncbi:Ankyrin-1 [Colletotrichum orbiculare MAFF 240422]|uniref:Ankyrin-1 n=1 Tax=Colletotrichum orbiculare (strain 104-T / ATCC 96160 / CBS 514.97 / LARS 414 / MAFF 240422) TaxID=1213857 RepID=A0A484F6E4_COLOR|nr:Ankyrin-1 [Colletotrichum orbiculare MAFF 240422]
MFENHARVSTRDQLKVSDQKKMRDGRNTRHDQDEQPAFAIRITAKGGVVSDFPADANRALSKLRDEAVLREASDDAAAATAARDKPVTAIVVGTTKFTFVSSSSGSDQPYGSESQRAAFEGNDERLQELIADPTSTMSDPTQCGTELGIACEQEHLNTIHLLLDHMPEINLEGENGYPRVLAGAKGRELVVRLLLDHGARVNLVCLRSGSPLAVASASPPPMAQAAGNGHVGIVKMLFDHRMESGNTSPVTEMVTVAFHDACLLGQTDVVELLLRKGADVNRRGGWFGTPLQAACFHGQMETILVLLKHQATIDLVANDRTALHVAYARGHYAVAKLLLDRGASFKARDAWIDTPLRQAFVAGNTSIVKLLRGRGAPADNLHGQPPNTEVALLLFPAWVPPQPAVERIQMNKIGSRGIERL